MGREQQYSFRVHTAAVHAQPHIIQCLQKSLVGGQHVCRGGGRADINGDTIPILFVQRIRTGNTPKAVQPFKSSCGSGQGGGGGDGRGRTACREGHEKEGMQGGRGGEKMNQRQLSPLPAVHVSARVNTQRLWPLLGEIRTSCDPGSTRNSQHMESSLCTWPDLADLEEILGHFVAET